MNNIITTQCQSEFPNITFRNITSKDGLTSDEVYAFAQGNDGQMWIGTANGLNKYDGTTINNYFKGTHPTIKLSSNLIWSLTKSHKNELWISDRNSISKISLHDLSTVKYNQYKSTKFDNPFKNNQLLFTCNEGLYKIEGATIKRLKLDNHQHRQIDHNTIKYDDITADQNGGYYVSAKSMISHLDENFNQKNTFPLPLKSHITDLYYSSNNDLWISTWGQGIYVLNKKNNKIINIFKGTDQQSIVQNITEWKINNQTYIIASRNTDMANGFVLINPRTLAYKYYSLNSTVHISYVDMDGNLWLGTNKGIFIVSHLQEVVQNIPIPTHQPELPLGFGNVYTIKETRDHFWLTKRYGHGIFKYDKNWKLIKEFGRFQLTDHPITNFIADGYDFLQKDKRMYSSTDLGIFIIDDNTHQRQHITPKDKSELKLRTIIPYNDTLWLLRSFDRGIIGFNPTNNSFLYPYLWPKSMTQLVNNYIFKTRDGTILISTNYGLYILDIIKKRYVKINNQYFNDIGVYGIAEDQNQKLWICTDSGLLQYDLKSNRVVIDFKQYPEMGSTYRVSIDDNNNVWFSNAKGYWCWNQKQNKMIKLNYSSGLITESNENCVLITSDQNILLGSRDLVHKIDSSYLFKKHIPKSLIISKLIVNNEEIIPVYKNGQYTVELAQGKFTIQLGFSVPDYSMQNSYHYEFKFDEDKQWSNLNDGKILLPNLESGNYKLGIKGVSNFNGSETAKTSLVISIPPYFYQRLWFKILLVLLLLTMAYIFYRWRLSNENAKNKIRADFESKMIHLEMQNLRSQMNPHFIFNSLNSINSFIVENKTHLASDYLTKFSKLIRMILDHSKNDVIPLSKEIEALSLYVMMEKNRFEQSFDFEIKIADDIDMGNVDVPPLILQPYIENAIWHGLMHQNTQGKITLSITYQQNKLIFTITDNGIGRQKAMEIKSKKNIKSASYGMEITKARILSHNPSNTVVVSDVMDAYDLVSGTQVTISILS